MLDTVTSIRLAFSSQVYKYEGYNVYKPDINVWLTIYDLLF